MQESSTMHSFSLGTQKKFAAALALTSALTLALGACKSDSTAPLVGNAIAADVASNNQSAAAGSALSAPVSVHVTDQNGNPIANVTVTWTVVSGAGSTSAATSATDATGTASISWTLDTLARTDSLKASIFAGASTYITATGTAGAPAAETKMSGDAQTDASGTQSAPMVIKVTDRYGNPVSGVVVAWVQSGGSLGAATTTTGADGTAQNTLMLSAGSGPYTVTASVGVSVAATFNLIAQ